jgi:trypsin
MVVCCCSRVPLLLLLPLLACLVADVSGRTERTRLVGGVVVRAEQYPFVVELCSAGSGAELKCCGTLVRADVVLTAAHCAIDFGGDAVLAVAGRTANDSRGVAIATAAPVVHAQYVDGRAGFDVALVPLRGAFDAARVPPLPPMRGGALAVQAPLRLASWGDVAAGHALSRELRHLDVSVLPLAACEAAFAASNFTVTLSDEQVCVGAPATQGTCVADSGAPAFVVGTNDTATAVAGLLSGGTSRDCSGNVSILTNVTFHADWIASELAKLPLWSPPAADTNSTATATAARASDSSVVTSSASSAAAESVASAVVPSRVLHFCVAVVVTLTRGVVAPP